MSKALSGKSTQGFIGKLLKFSGNRGEDQEKLARNWPFPEPKLNNEESHRYCDCVGQGVKKVGGVWVCKHCQRPVSNVDLAFHPDNV